jgi:type 1 glutamine amidotransferase
MTWNARLLMTVAAAWIAFGAYHGEFAFAQAPQVVSPEILPDRRVAFRIYAPEARAIRLERLLWFATGKEDRLITTTFSIAANQRGPASPKFVSSAANEGRQAARAPQNQTPNPADVQMMMAALPDKAPATPKQPRKILVLGRAAGFVHSSIPLAARTVEEMGKKTRAWTTTITYDAADINEQNLKQYDAIFLASTTGAFLDDPNDEAATAARRKALLDFVRGGKGLAGIHAASDSYHRSTAPAAVPRSAAPSTSVASRGNASPRPAPKLGPTGFPIQSPATELGADTQVGTWPEFNRLIGAFFKFHWNDGQLITVKVEEPNHPLNAAFKGQSLQVIDETYTFGRQTYSRENLRVLTSIDYAKMSAEDKAKEQYPRADGDYALSWIRREGQGRVFYEAHGHNEKVYGVKPILEHVLAGIQYVLGDLPADDRPSVRAGTR